MLFFFCVLLLILCLFYFNIYLYNNEKTRCINKIPGPNHLPFIGNALQIPSDPVKLFESIRTWGKTYYPIYKMWLGPKPLVIIHHPDDLEIIMSSKKHINKDFGYESIRQILDDGLLVSKGPLWHHRRKILTPAFHFKILQKYLHPIIELGNQFIKDNRTGEKETIKELFQLYTGFTLDVICESAMGISLGDVQHQTSGKKYRDAIPRLNRINVYRLTNPYIKDWMMPFFPKLNKEFKEADRDVRSFIANIVKERRQYHESINYQSLNVTETSELDTELDELDSYGQHGKLSMLDLLLECEKNDLIDDKGIKDEVSTFVVEGFDTAANTLSFTTLLLAENKDIQDKIRAEVEEILKSNNGNLKISDLQKMTYLERCIKESLRFFPPVPYITRYLMEDVQLKNYKIPKGTNVLLNIFEVQRNSEFWPEPEKFDPDRFLVDNSKKRHPYSYIPFSAGPRNCIGQKFAMMELKIALVNILSNFYLEPVTFTKDLKLKTAIDLSSSTPLYTKFIRIDKK